MWLALSTDTAMAATFVVAVFSRISLAVVSSSA
jgi:hypothetical protein